MEVLDEPLVTKLNCYSSFIEKIFLERFHVIFLVFCSFLLLCMASAVSLFKVLLNSGTSFCQCTCIFSDVVETQLFQLNFAIG